MVAVTTKFAVIPTVPWLMSSFPVAAADAKLTHLAHLMAEDRRRRERPPNLPSTSFREWHSGGCRYRGGKLGRKPELTTHPAKEALTQREAHEETLADIGRRPQPRGSFMGASSNAYFTTGPVSVPQPGQPPKSMSLPLGAGAGAGVGVGAGVAVVALLGRQRRIDGE